MTKIRGAVVVFALLCTLGLFGTPIVGAQDTRAGRTYGTRSDAISSRGTLVSGPRATVQAAGPRYSVIDLGSEDIFQPSKINNCRQVAGTQVLGVRAALWQYGAITLLAI